MLKIRRSHDSLIVNMRITIPGKDGLYIETGPRSLVFSFQDEIQPPGAQSRRRKTDDITRILIVIVIVFIACQPWEPVRRILEHHYGFQGCGHGYFIFEEFPSLSFAVNSAANIIIYYMLGSKFRILLRRRFGYKTPDNGLDDSNSRNLTQNTRIVDDKVLTRHPSNGDSCSNHTPDQQASAETWFSACARKLGFFCTDF